MFNHICFYGIDLAYLQPCGKKLQYCKIHHSHLQLKMGMMYFAICSSVLKKHRCM
ncbi:hypothetical protein L9F63_005170, partial [Diploptera punctata]